MKRTIKLRINAAKVLWCAVIFVASIAGCGVVSADETPAVNNTIKSGELLKNPGFEDVVEEHIKSWSAQPFAVIPSDQDAGAGQHSLEITSAQKGFDPISTQNVTDFKAGQLYHFSYRVRTAQEDQEYRLYIGIWNDELPKATWLTGVEIGWRKGQEKWQDVTFDFTPAASANRLMVVMQIKGPGSVWFDDLSLTAAAEEKLPPALTSYSGSPEFVQIMPDRTFRVQGKPFFPLLIWGWNASSEEALAKAGDFGFNVVASPPIETLGLQGAQLWFDMAEKYHLMVAAPSRLQFKDTVPATELDAKLSALTPLIKRLAQHPALFMYNPADEPAWGRYNIEAFAATSHLIRSLDPNHPIFVTHAPRNTIAELARYNRYLDIGGSDIYPVWKGGIDRHSDLPNKTLSVVGDETQKNLEALGDTKPVIETLQAFSWSDGANSKRQGDPFPTLSQLRFMAYDAIVSGATGIAFFQDGRYTVLRPELKPIVRELAALGETLAGGKILSTQNVTTTPKLKLLAKEYQGHLMLIAVNTNNQPLIASLNISSLDSGRFSNRKIKTLFENSSNTTAFRRRYF